MRGQGEGSIYRRGDGYWVGQVEIGHYPNGRRRRARVVRRYRADVVEALDELRRQVRDGVVPDRTRSVATFLAFWLDEVAAGQAAESASPSIGSGSPGSRRTSAGSSSGASRRRTCTP